MPLDNIMSNDAKSGFKLTLSNGKSFIDNNVEYEVKKTYSLKPGPHGPANDAHAKPKFGARGFHFCTLQSIVSGI